MEKGGEEGKLSWANSALVVRIDAPAFSAPR